MLDVLRADTEYAPEYKRFVKGLSYADPEQTPGFTEAIEALQNLVKALCPDTNLN